LEGWPEGTAYVSTGGGFGPHAGEALRSLLPVTARLVAATDRGGGGELLADRLRDLAATACAGFGRLRPIAKDWNDQLTGQSLSRQVCTVQTLDEPGASVVGVCTVQTR
jgi:hypothetical protein